MFIGYDYNNYKVIIKKWLWHGNNLSIHQQMNGTFNKIYFAVPQLLQIPSHLSSMYQNANYERKAVFFPSVF